MSAHLSLSQWISQGIFLAILVGIPLYGHYKKVPVYECFIDGAKHGFDVAVKIIPFLVAMIVAIGMLKASGAFTSFSNFLHPILAKIGVDPDLVPLALIRPFSGSASNAMLNEIAGSHGGDSLVAKTAATIIGSTETTFYIVAVYFGSVNIKRTRYAVPAGLAADLAGIIASIVICRWMLG